MRSRLGNAKHAVQHRGVWRRSQSSGVTQRGAHLNVRRQARRRSFVPEAEALQTGTQQMGTWLGRRPSDDPTGTSS